MIGAVASWLMGSAVGRRIAMVLAFIGATLAVLSVFARHIRKRERAEAEARGMRETMRRTDAGRSAAQRAEASLRAGGAPEAIVARNDSRW